MASPVTAAKTSARSSAARQRRIEKELRVLDEGLSLTLAWFRAKLGTR